MLVMKCQNEAYSGLQLLSQHDAHAIIINGPPGCGKTYLAKQYGLMIGVSDFELVDPTVQSIRDAITKCYENSNAIVLCVENIDTGVLGASYTLLKFLEEPLPSVYLILTCRNINVVPDTIISRSSVIEVTPCTSSDINDYAEHVDFAKYSRLNKLSIWRVIKSFSDVHNVFALSNDQLNYFDTLSKDVMLFKDSVSNLCWKIEHYPDNSPSPVELVLRYMICFSSGHIRSCAISCLNDLCSRRIGVHAVIAKFVFECKYCE